MWILELVGSSLDAGCPVVRRAYAELRIKLKAGRKTMVHEIARTSLLELQ